VFPRRLGGLVVSEIEFEGGGRVDEGGITVINFNNTVTESTSVFGAEV
jgi:hypothetical protein